jgi:high affinity Mn2+ porin
MNGWAMQINDLILLACTVAALAIPFLDRNWRWRQMTKRRVSASHWLAVVTAVSVAVSATAAEANDAMPKPAPTSPYSSTVYDWTGFYVGGHTGYAGGSSGWTAVNAAGGVSNGTLDLFQPFDLFTTTGSFFGGVQAGYNFLLPNRLVVGGEIDASFPSWPNLSGVTTGGTSTFVSPAIGAESYGETVLSMGTVRGRVGYAPGNWLFYATGGFAWSYDQLTLMQLATGTTGSPFLWRLGWAAGLGVEVLVAPHWTARVEYLFIDYGTSSVTVPAAAQSFNSNFSLQELRAGLDYQFGDGSALPNLFAIASPLPDGDRFNVHGQSTFLEQAYPAFRSPYEGPQSLTGSGQGRETWDATLYAGMRLWQGAELWINPEIDQGFGLNGTLGVAGFPSAEAYKLGAAYPYERVQRAFIRQTIDFGGDVQKVDAGINQFAESQTANRLVLTVGRFSVVDVFDNNKYAHDPRNDFMNWAVVDTGTFDYAADPWGYTYGGAAEWYRGNWTLRGGLFDLSILPNNLELDPTFQQFQWVGEIENRYDLWGHPGKIAITGFLSRGRMASFADAIVYGEATGGPAELAPVRQYQSRGGVSMNLEQELTPDLGAFVRAGWADSDIEPYEFTDVDRTVAAGLQLKGSQWGRPDDTVGIAGVVNGISAEHEAFFNDGGLGILIGDGQLPRPGAEQILETYYSYAPSNSTWLTVDYQFINNPAYNTERGPANVFAGRFHWQF